MIKITLYSLGDLITGFEISGHSTQNADDFDGKLVCSAVSSATIMAANTITEIIGDESDVECYDGYLKLICRKADCCQSVLEGLKLHLEQLHLQYQDRISLTLNRL